MEYKGGVGNGILRMADGGGNGALSAMCFSVKGSNRESPRSASGGGSRALRTMEVCERVKKTSMWRTKAEAAMEH